MSDQELKEIVGDAVRIVREMHDVQHVTNLRLIDLVRDLAGQVGRLEEDLKGELAELELRISRLEGMAGV